MRKISKTAKLAVAGVSVGTLALSGVAYAYWSTTGSGTGSATTGTSSAITVHGAQVGDSTGLTPGGPGATIHFTADNPSSGHQFVAKVHLVSVDAYATAADRTAGTNAINGTGATQCDTSNYSMSDVTENQDIAPGNGTSLTANDGTLVLANASGNQDGCKGAFLTLNLTSN